MVWNRTKCHYNVACALWCINMVFFHRAHRGPTKAQTQLQIQLNKKQNGEVYDAHNTISEQTEQNKNYVWCVSCALCTLRALRTAYGVHTNTYYFVQKLFQTFFAEWMFEDNGSNTLTHMCALMFFHFSESKVDPFATDAWLWDLLPAPLVIMICR